MMANYNDLLVRHISTHTERSAEDRAADRRTSWRNCCRHQSGSRKTEKYHTSGE